MSKVIGRIILFILRTALLAGICYGLFWLGSHAYGFGYEIYSEKGVEEYPGTDMAVTVEEGETVRAIARKFERLGLIKDARVFCIQERLSRYHGEIIAGSYVLNTSQSGNVMIEILTGHREENSSQGDTADDR